MTFSNDGRNCAVFIIVLCVLCAVGYGSNLCQETVDITDGTKEGLNITKDGLTFTQDDYFKDGNLIKGCVCKVTKCLRRCCNSNESLSYNNDDTVICVASNTRVSISSDLEPVLHQNVSLFHIISVPDREVCLKEEEYKVFLYDDDIEINSSGSLIWGEDVFTYDKFCASNLDGRLGALICIMADVDVNALIYCIGMIISMPFLLITFLVYAILPDRNLHQRALMFYVLALLASYILLVTINLSDNLSAPWCEIFAYSTLYFFMVSFFWMNVICFDIWYTFSGGRGFAGTKRTSERKRLMLYSLYAFGLPLLVAIIVFVLQIVLPESSDHNPGIGISKCFLADGWPNLWYFYGEAGILVITNITFFLLTAFKIRQVKKETSMLKQNDSKRHSYEKDKQKFNLYVKLLLAMGVNWSMEVISWLVNWRTNGKVTYIWYATDFFNAGYGVFIFFTFVFKKKIWKLLQRRYYNFTGKPHLAHTMTSTNTRTSHYSSTNYSTADTTLSDRTSVANAANAANGRARPEELALRRVT